eukprot:1591000-Alexandrium_andersonii.AAC.1
MLVEELERAAQPPCQAFLRQLRRYGSVELWPMPPGYKKRLAAQYLAKVYSSGTALAHAKEWIR